MVSYIVAAVIFVIVLILRTMNFIATKEKKVSETGKDEKGKAKKAEKEQSGSKSKKPSKKEAKKTKKKDEKVKKKEEWKTMIGDGEATAQTADETKAGSEAETDAARESQPETTAAETEADKTEAEKSESEARKSANEGDKTEAEKMGSERTETAADAPNWDEFWTMHGACVHAEHETYTCMRVFLEWRKSHLHVWMVWKTVSPDQTRSGCVLGLRYLCLQRAGAMRVCGSGHQRGFRGVHGLCATGVARTNRSPSLIICCNSCVSINLEKKETATDIYSNDH